MPWGSSDGDVPDGVEVWRDDFADPATPATGVDRVIAEHGRLDIVIATHARSADGDLDSVTADELDACFAVNVRSVVLLAQAFAAAHSPSPSGQPPCGRMMWFTSGQHLGPMPGELPYVVSKGALHQMTVSLSASLASAGIVANCINPGPGDTGYADAATVAAVAQRFPDGRWGHPDDIADLVEFLASDRGAWIRGQVLNTEGGFDRFG